MASLEDLATQELMIIAKLRNVDDYQNMSREKPESIFTAPFSSKPTLKPKPRPKKRTLMPAHKLLQDLKNLNLRLLQE